MANEDILQEIESLRQQLEAMKHEREAGRAAPGEAQDQSEETAIPLPASLSKDSIEDLLSQFKELLESIDKDIKDTKPTTLLVVFALGVLVGRL